MNLLHTHFIIIVAVEICRKKGSHGDTSLEKFETKSFTIQVLFSITLHVKLYVCVLYFCIYSGTHCIQLASHLVSGTLMCQSLSVSVTIHSVSKKKWTLCKERKRVV